MNFYYNLALLVVAHGANLVRAAAYAAPMADAVYVTVEAEPIYKTNYIYVETVVVSVDGNAEDSVVTVLETGKYETVLVTQKDGSTVTTTIVADTPATTTSAQYIPTSSSSASSSDISSYPGSSSWTTSLPNTVQSSTSQLSVALPASSSTSVETSGVSVAATILATDESVSTFDSSVSILTSSGVLFTSSSFFTSPSITATTFSAGDILAEKSTSSSVFDSSVLTSSSASPSSSLIELISSAPLPSTSSSSSVTIGSSTTSFSAPGTPSLSTTAPSTSSISTSSTSTSSTSTSSTSTLSTSTSSTSTSSTSTSSTSTSSTSTSSTSTSSTSTTSTSTSSTSTSSTSTSSVKTTSSSGAVSNIVPTAIVYSPYTDSGGCKDASAVKSDLELISSKNIGQIRVYATDCDSINTIQPAAANLGIKINQGFWIDDTGVNSIDDQVSTIISYGETNGWDIFTKIVVGNEAILNGWVTASELLAKGQSVVSQLRSAGYTGPVLTAEPPVTFTDNPSLCTSGVFDAIGINSHSYYATNVDAAQAGEFVAGQLQTTEELCSVPVYVTETGYPSAGNTNGENVPSAENQKIALAALLSSLNGDCTILTTYNDYWKQPGPYNIEQHFGAIQLLA